MKLPAIIFLDGPTGIGKTYLCNSLIDFSGVPVMGLSFYTPIYGGCTGTFFDHDPGMMLEQQRDQTTIDGDTAGKFCNAYHQFLQGRYGESILGRMALRHLEEGADYFSTFVFDDTNFVKASDIEAIAKAVGPENCRHVFLHQHSTDEMPDLAGRAVPAMHYLTSSFLSPEDLARNFIKHLLEPTHAQG